MANYIVRPTSYLSGNGYATTNATSNADMASKLGDNSDLTTVVHTSTSATQYRFALGAPTIPSDEYVCRIGQSLRWKGGGDSGSGAAYIGVSVYRSTDPNPSGYSSVQSNGSLSFITTEVGQVIAPWTAAEVAALRLAWYDGRNTFDGAMPTVTTADLWATIYTIKKASVSVANQGSTQSYPVIATTTTATIDWESTSYDWQQWRKIRTEVQIESGGTGAGTGTLIASGYTETLFTATGSQTVNVTLGSAVPNGTYNIYARTIRFREDNTSGTDTTSAWTTAATLTQNITPPSTPTFSVTADQVNDRATISVTPVSSAGFTSPIIEVQRSSDGGTTWTAIRGSSIAGTFGSAATLYDYELPRGVLTAYRARITATYTGGLINSSAWTTPSSITITVADWNMKVPETPSLNVLDVQVIDKPTEELTEDLGVFRPLDRRYPIVVAGSLGGYDGDLLISTSTSTEWTNLKAILEAQKVIYLESAFGWAKYIRITSGARVTLLGSATSPRRQVAISYVEVAAP